MIRAIILEVFNQIPWVFEYVTRYCLPSNNFNILIFYIIINNYDCCMFVFVGLLFCCSFIFTLKLNSLVTFIFSSVFIGSCLIIGWPFLDSLVVLIFSSVFIASLSYARLTISRFLENSPLDMRVEWKWESIVLNHRSVKWSFRQCLAFN